MIENRNLPYNSLIMDQKQLDPMKKITCVLFFISPKLLFCSEGRIMTGIYVGDDMTDE